MLTETSQFMMSFVLVTKRDNVIVIDGGTVVSDVAGGESTDAPAADDVTAAVLDTVQDVPAEPAQEDSAIDAMLADILEPDNNDNGGEAQ